MANTISTLNDDRAKITRNTINKDNKGSSIKNRPYLQYYLYAIGAFEFFQVFRLYKEVPVSLILPFLPDKIGEALGSEFRRLLMAFLVVLGLARLSLASQMKNAKLYRFVTSLHVLEFLYFLVSSSHYPSRKKASNGLVAAVGLNCVWLAASYKGYTTGVGN